MSNTVFILLIFTGFALGCDGVSVNVNSAEGIYANLFLKDNDSFSVSTLKNGKIISTEYVDVSSDKKNHITIEDYNRDGYKDFSIWHLDEGMGFYKIYRLFIFSHAKGKFKEVKPLCGDDFVNIRIEGKVLINMIYDNNTPKSCVMSLKKLN